MLESVQISAHERLLVTRSGARRVDDMVPSRLRGKKLVVVKVGNRPQADSYLYYEVRGNTQNRVSDLVRALNLDEIRLVGNRYFALQHSRDGEMLDGFFTRTLDDVIMPGEAYQLMELGMPLRPGVMMPP